MVPDKLNSDGIAAMGIRDSSTIVATKDYSFFSIGTNNLGQLGQNWTTPVNDITTMNFQKRVKQILVCETHSMLVTNDGQIFHLGSNDYFQNGENSNTRNNTPKLLSLNKQLTCEMISGGEYYTIFIMRDIVTGKRKLYAAGWSKQGRTGTGKDEEYHAFKLIPCTDIENVEFKYVSSGKLCSAAVSTTGKLYTWGTNSRGQLGLGHYNDVLEPTLVTYFDKYEVQTVSMANEHCLVIAKDEPKNKISVFGFGDSSNGKLGETITQKSEKKDTVPTPIRISFFEGRNPSKVYAGPRASMVICKLKPYETLRDIHTGTTCSLCNKNPIIGNLYSEIHSDLDIPKHYCNECIKVVDMSDKNPRIVFKAPIKADYNIITQMVKKHPNLDTENNIDAENLVINCKHCKESINLPKSGAYLYLEQKTKLALCNNCIDSFPSTVTSAKVYIRAFKNYKNIDITNTTNFYDNSISYGHKFTITPILNEKGCEGIIEKHQQSFNNFVDDINEYNKFEVFEQLVDMLNNIAQKAEKSIYTYLPKELAFKKEELSVRNALEKCSPEVLRKMFVCLKILNNKVKELLPYIDFSKVLQDNQRLSFHFNKITPLIFWDTKNELIKYYLEKTSAEHECTELKINRMKVRRFIEKGKPDHTGEYTVFGQIFQFLKSRSFKIFKKKEGGNNNKMFNVTFVGEASIDAGGPYREALTQACTELQSSAVPLFIPSPNQKNESGLFREKWVINPSAKSTTHLEMYRIFGGLIGYAIRTGEFLNMDLPSIFWKQILEAPLERKDLEHIDRYTIQCLDDIINIHKKGVTADSFSFYVDQKFTTCLSDGSEVEVVPEGRNIELTYQDRVKYCELVEKIRFEESKIQILAIRSGLQQVIPVGLLKLLSWKELETLVCGKPIMDIELLKENSVYRGCTENDMVIQNLWKCLEEFTAEERSMYLRFVWGRSRLPLTSKDFPMKHRIEMY
jgi:alpha-tubulin suppressor-like RCC1 family protein